MTKIELLHYIEHQAEAFSKQARAAILQDHTSGVEEISQEQINAVLAGFINHIGLEQGVNYGMYARDLGNRIKGKGNK